MRFYHCFWTDLPDQFIESNAKALIAWLGGWAGAKRYYRRALIVDNVALAVLGDATKICWPTLAASSDKMLSLWMSKKGDQFNGRYWESLAPDQRGAADPAGDPGRDLADAAAFTWYQRTSFPKSSWRSLSGGRASGKSLMTQQIIQQASAMLGARSAAADRMLLDAMMAGMMGVKPTVWLTLDGDHPARPPLQRDGIVAGEITGYRCWRVDQGFLRSVYQADIWPPQQILQGRELEDWNARGIHAWKSASSKQYFEYLRSYMDRRDNGGLFGRTMLDLGEKCPAMVTGSVLLWGDVVEHERGWRAEFARVRSLDWLYPDASMMGRERQTLDDLRCRYGVAEVSR